MNEEQDQKILTVLSMNGRAPAKLIGKLAGISPQKAYRSVKALEKRLNIRYLAEINIENLGYLKFIVLIKFLKDIPQTIEIKKAFESKINIQYATILRGGDYDLLLYVLAENITDISYICSDLRRNTVLATYSAEWYISLFYEHYNFMPLRNEFVDSLKEKVIKKGKKALRSNKEKQILQREFTTLRELNINGSSDLLDIDKKYGFDGGRSQYAYYKLIENGILNRITISIQNLPIRYTVALFITVTDQKEYYESRDVVLKEIITDRKYGVNKYALAGDTMTPFGALLFLSVFEEQDLDDALTIISKARGIRVKSAIISNTIIGTLCYRRFDPAYSEQAHFLQKDFGIRSGSKIEYTERKRYYGVKTTIDSSN